MNWIVRRIVHYSDVPSEELRKIVTNFSRDFNIYPNFYVELVEPQKAWYQKWGWILLFDMPRGRLDPYNKYLLIMGLSFHGLMPATEINRLLIFSAARKVFNVFQDDRLGILMSIFSTLFAFTRLINNANWRREVISALEYVTSSYKKPRTKIVKLILGYYNALLMNKFDGVLAKINRILLSNLPTYLKAKFFFERISQIEKTFEPWTYQKRLLKRIVIPISSDENLMKSSDFHSGREITLEDIEQLAQVDYKLARKIAIKIDKEKRVGGRMPLYSENETMLQKLLKERRYTAAVRRVRIRQLLSVLETMLLRENFVLMRYGYDQWFVGDDEEFLDVEASADSFGKVVPNLSTLKNIYEYGGHKIASETVGHVEVCIDTSGSMIGEPLERAIDVGIALIEIAKKYEKTIALTTFSSGAWQGIIPTQNYDLVEEIVLRLEADGGTNIRHVFSVIDGHLSYINEKAIVVFITDTMIYDIDFPTVVSSLEDLSERAKICVIALTNEVWWKTKRTMASAGIDIIQMSPREANEEKIEILFDFAKRYFDSRPIYM
ncbi:MAG: VWA domain-containing protein [Candidatus Njordarchaeota archaeon]